MALRVSDLGFRGSLTALRVEGLGALGLRVNGFKGLGLRV